MKAMILAAGLGTRLRPLTNDRPKALVTLAGRTLLEITLARLRTFGVTEVIVNTHHHADQIAEYLAAHQNFGMRIEISPEPNLLDTGGGLNKAAPFFLSNLDSGSGPAKDAPCPIHSQPHREWVGNPESGEAALVVKADNAQDEPFLLHNVDVLSTIDLCRMIEFHNQHHAIATLAVQERPTSRYLLFDESGELCGRRAALDGSPELVRPASAPQAFAFSGIHVLSPRIFSKITEQGAFSIIDCYLRLAATGQNILAFRADDSYWRDLGRPQSIQQAEQDIENNQLPEA